MQKIQKRVPQIVKMNFLCSLVKQKMFYIDGNKYKLCVPFYLKKCFNNFNVKRRIKSQ